MRSIKKSLRTYEVRSDVVQIVGLEPTRWYHWNLNPARLPIPPYLQNKSPSIFTRRGNPGRSISLNPHGKNEISPIFTKNNDNTGLFTLSRKLSAEVFKHKKIWYNNFVYSGVVEHIGSTSDRSAPRPFPGDDRDGRHAVRGKWTGVPGI